MLSLVALAAAAVSAPTPSPAFNASAPWWDKVVMTIDGDGKEHACRYETSVDPALTESCADEKSAASGKASTGPAGLLTKLTFERRFSPGIRPEPGKLQVGDELVGRQVIHLTIDNAGAVKSCKVVDVTGDVPEYGCKEAQTETFMVKASAPAGELRQAFMTILVYGHAEQIV